MPKVLIIYIFILKQNSNALFIHIILKRGIIMLERYERKFGENEEINKNSSGGAGVDAYDAAFRRM